MAKRRSPSDQFKPVVVYDTMGYIRQYQIAACADGEEVTLLMSDTTRYDVFTREIVAGQIGNRYGVSDKDPAAMAAKFREKAMTYGATPEAIRLIGLLCPLSKQEEFEMSEKKLAPKKGDKEGLKAAAKAAPVGGKKAPAEKPANRKGNPEALEKAREATAARTEARDKQKIKVVNKNHGAREGTKRAEMLDIVIKAKTVGEAIENGAGWIDVKFAVDKGFITLA